MVENVRTTFEEYIDPSEAAPDATAVHVPENPVVADPAAASARRPVFSTPGISMNPIV